MTLFIALATGLLVLALWPLLQVLLRAPGGQARMPVAQTHLALLHAERAQLDADRTAGVIAADEHALAIGELARRVLQESASAEPAHQTAYRMLTAGFLLLAVPATALGLYNTVGSPDAVLQASSVPSEGATLADVDAMVREMQAALEAGAAKGEPQNAKAWEMLARTQAGMQRYAQAAQSYQRAIAIDPDNPDLLADRADLVSLLQAPGATTEAAQLVQRALEIKPDHPKALALAGGAAFERQDFAAAEAYWSRVRAVVPAGTPFAEGLDRSIEAARAGLQANAPAALVASATTVAPAPPARATSAAAGGITGRVELSAALQARLQPGDTLFIVARTPQGPRMPLAVLRQNASALPVDFNLSDAQAMTPDHKLSGQPQVVLEARISRSGNAMSQSGDLLGRSAPMSNTSQGVRLVIDQIVP